MAKLQSTFLLLVSILLVYTNFSVSASPLSPQSQQAKIIKTKKLLQKEKAFCRAFLGNTLPFQSTNVVTKTNTMTSSPPVQTVTNFITTIDAMTVFESTVETISGSTTLLLTDTQVITSTLATVTVPSPIVTATVSSPYTLTETDSTTITSAYSTLTIYAPTVTSTSSVQATSAVTSTVTSTVTQTSISFSPIVTSTSTGSTSYITTIIRVMNTKRSLPTGLPNMISKRAAVTKPKAVMSLPDEIITDACLLLLYGTYSKLPATSTQTNTVTHVLPVVSTTASLLSTVYQTTTSIFTALTTAVATLSLESTKESVATATATVDETSTMVVTVSPMFTNTVTSTAIISTIATLTTPTTTIAFTTLTSTVVTTATDTVTTTNYQPSITVSVVNPTVTVVTYGYGKIKVIDSTYTPIIGQYFSYTAGQNFAGISLSTSPSEVSYEQTQDYFHDVQNINLNMNIVQYSQGNGVPVAMTNTGPQQLFCQSSTILTCSSNYGSSSPQNFFYCPETNVPTLIWFGNPDPTNKNKYFCQSLTLAFVPFNS